MSHPALQFLELRTDDIQRQTGPNLYNIIVPSGGVVDSGEVFDA